MKEGRRKEEKEGKRWMSPKERHQGCPLASVSVHIPPPAHSHEWTCLQASACACTHIIKQVKTPDFASHIIIARVLEAQEGLEC